MRIYVSATYQTQKGGIGRCDYTIETEALETALAVARKRLLRDKRRKVSRAIDMVARAA